MIKVLLVDDQLLFRESLKIIIERSDEIEVIGCAENGLAALKFCDGIVPDAPDVVLMDIGMPLCDGVEGTRLIKKEHPGIKILILTSFSDSENIANALKNGANGYVLKDLNPDALIQAIKNIANGMAVIHPMALDAIVKQIVFNESNTRESENKVTFTERELKVIQLIVDGKSNKEIAMCLKFTDGSVKNIITDILIKCKLKDRTQLAVFAVKRNII